MQTFTDHLLGTQHCVDAMEGPKQCSSVKKLIAMLGEITQIKRINLCINNIKKMFL